MAALPVAVVLGTFVVIGAAQAGNALKGGGVALLFALIPLSMLGIVLGLVTWFSRRSGQKYQAVMESVAAERGFVFVPQMHERMSARLRRLPFFQQGHTQSTFNVLQGRLGDSECIVCRHRWITGHGKNRATHSRLVVVLADVPVRLPDFQLVPEQWYHKVGGLFGMKDIGFGGSDEAARFSARYRLTGPSEDAIRDAFTEPVVNWFADHPGWTVQSSGQYLLFSRPSSLKSFSFSLSSDPIPKAEDVLQLIDESAEAAALLVPSQLS